MRRAGRVVVRPQMGMEPARDAHRLRFLITVSHRLITVSDRAVLCEEPSFGL